MKIFRSIQENFAILGVNPNQLTKKNNINVKNLISLFFHGFIIIAYLLYLARIANSFREYTDGIFATSAVLVCGASMIIIVWKMPKLFKLIDKLENVINCSE